MARQCMSWTRFTMVMDGGEPKKHILIMSLDRPTVDLHMLGIVNVLMNLVIINGEECNCTKWIGIAPIFLGWLPPPPLDKSKL